MASAPSPPELADERADFRGPASDWLDARPGSGARFCARSIATHPTVPLSRLLTPLLSTATAASLVLGIGAAHASDLFFSDIPVVLTASRMAQSPLDAPVAVTVIDRDMIRASGFTEIHDLLRLAVRADDDPAAAVTLRHRSRFGLDLLLDFAAEAASADDEEFFHGIRARRSAKVRQARICAPVTVS